MSQFTDRQVVLWHVFMYSLPKNCWLPFSRKSSHLGTFPTLVELYRVAYSSSRLHPPNTNTISTAVPPMPAVPYLPQDISGSVANEIRSRRGAEGLLPLDRILLHAPPIAEGWSKLLGAVRTGSLLEDDLREIIVSDERDSL